jgi:hypothetical protein
LRRPITGTFVNVNERPIGPTAPRSVSDAHMKLMDIVPRSLYRGEIYEIFLTDDPRAAPGRKIRGRFSLVGHFEVEQGSFVRAGDHVLAGGKDLGTIAGYNACPALRAPESVVIHIYVKAKRLASGKDLGLTLGDQVTTIPVDPK